MNCVNCDKYIEFNQISPTPDFCLDCYHYHQEKLDNLADRYYGEDDWLEINGKELWQLITNEDIEELRQAQRDLNEYASTEDGLKLVAEHLGEEWSKQMPSELKLIEMRLEDIERQRQNYQSFQQVANR